MVLKIFKKKLFSKFLNRGFVLSGLLENQHKYILNSWYGCTEKCPPEATLSFFSQIYQGKVVYFISELEIGDFRAKNW